MEFVKKPAVQMSLKYCNKTYPSSATPCEWRLACWKRAYADASQPSEDSTKKDLVGKYTGLSFSLGSIASAFFPPFSMFAAASQSAAK